jgi:hypothetical protein
MRTNCKVVRTVRDNLAEWERKLSPPQLLSPANTPPPEALLQDTTCPVDIIVGREGGQNAGDDKIIVEEATKELPLLTAQPSPPPPPPPPPMLPPPEIAAAAAAEADGAPPRIPRQEPVEATTPLVKAHTKALNKVLDFDIPDFLGGWLPGQLLSHETMKRILFDTQFHRKYMAMVEEMLAEIFDITQRHFHSQSLRQPYDSAHTVDSMQEGQHQWKTLWDEHALSHASVTGTAIDEFKEEEPSSSELYATPSSEAEMRAKFVRFLQNKTARGKTVQLSPVTIGSYVNSVFSRTRPSSVSNYVRATFGKDGSDLTSFLFAEDRATMVLDLGVLSAFFPKDPRYAQQTGETSAAANVMPTAQRKTSAQFVQSCSGLINLLDYMLCHAKHRKIPPDHIETLNRRNEYIQDVGILRSELAKKVTQLHKESAKESKTNRLARDLLEPESNLERLSAYKKYFRGTHFNRTLKALKQQVETLEDIPPRGSSSTAGPPPVVISPLQFKRFGFWLMINVSFFNGARPQVVQLITNRYFHQRTTVLCPDEEETGGSGRASKYTGCLVTRDLDMKGNTMMVSIPLGTLDNRIIGKTGEAEVTVPVDLAHGLINYSLIKEKMGPPLNRPEDSFFVDEAGKPLLLSNAQNSRTGQEMAKEMGITRLLTFTEQRRVVASKMISAGATGNTGMAHTPAVQGTPPTTYVHKHLICIHTLILSFKLLYFFIPPTLYNAGA